VISTHYSTLSLAIYPNRKTSTPVWTSRRSGNRSKDTEKILDRRRTPHCEECEIQVRLLSAEGTEKRNTNYGKPPTISTCTIHTTVLLYSCRPVWSYQSQSWPKQDEKYWGVLFTCLNVRAVYIDVATDYSTPGILPVLRRFFCIRGYPRCLWSDRGSQLVGAEAELWKAIEGRDTTELKDFLHEKGMEWKFVTPTAAHHNGCAESLIRVTKAALKKSIRDQVLAPLECQTVLFETPNWSYS
jgi:hypothetical protein